MYLYTTNSTVGQVGNVCQTYFSALCFTEQDLLFFILLNIKMKNLSTDYISVNNIIYIYTPSIRIQM